MIKMTNNADKIKQKVSFIGRKEISEKCPCACHYDRLIRQIIAQEIFTEIEERFKEHIKENKKHGVKCVNECIFLELQELKQKFGVGR